MKEIKTLAFFMFLSSAVSLTCLIFVCKEGMETKRLNIELKGERDMFRRALIKGNTDILKARRIINDNKIMYEK